MNESFRVPNVARVEWPISLLPEGNYHGTVFHAELMASQSHRIPFIKLGLDVEEAPEVCTKQVFAYISAPYVVARPDSYIRLGIPQAVNDKTVKQMIGQRYSFAIEHEYHSGNVYYRVVLDKLEN